jgi:alkylhydroperoxidase family enzyme
LGALAGPTQSDLFSERERAALIYAEAITLANTVSDDIFESVRRHFNDDEIVELSAVITFEICVAKFNRALEIEAQGICAVRPPVNRTSTEPGS